MGIRITSLRVISAASCLACLLAATAAGRVAHAQPASAQPAPLPAQESAGLSSRAPWSVVEAGADLAMQALTHLGVPYRFGGQDPQRGFDCSGLVRHVAQAALGLDLPRTAEAMARIGKSVAREALQVGDLVFFNTRGRRYSHVGIYIGEGRFVHAPARRGQVRVEDVDGRYWQTRFNGARRLAVSAPVEPASEPLQWRPVASEPPNAPLTAVPAVPPTAPLPAPRADPGDHEPGA